MKTLTVIVVFCFTLFISGCVNEEYSSTPKLQLVVATTFGGDLAFQNNDVQDYHNCNITINKNWILPDQNFYSGTRVDISPS